MGKTTTTTPPAPPAKGEPASAAAPATKKVLRVLCNTEGFRRAGRAFGPKPTDIEIDELDEKTLRQLQTEPKLVTAFVDVPVEQPADQAEGAGT